MQPFHINKMSKIQEMLDMNKIDFTTSHLKTEELEPEPEQKKQTQSTSKQNSPRKTIMVEECFSSMSSESEKEKKAGIESMVDLALYSKAQKPKEEVSKIVLTQGNHMESRNR